MALKKAIMDSALLAFFKRAFEHMLSKVIQKRYPQYSCREMFPVTPEGGEGIDSIAYEVWDETGIADWVSAYAGDIPRAEVNAEKFVVPVHRMALAFGMTLDEIKKSNRTGIPLSNKKASAVRKGHEHKLNTTAFEGDSKRNLQGLFSHPSIPNGEAAYLDWEDGVVTAAQILQCFSAGILAVQSATNSIEKVTAIRIPSTIYTYLALKKFSDYTETTVLEWLKLKLAAVGVTEVLPYHEGEAVAYLAGDPVTDFSGVTSSTTKVICYYDKDDAALELSIPEDMDFLEPQQEGLEQVSIGTMTTGGLIVYKPLSIFLQACTS